MSCQVNACGSRPILMGDGYMDEIASISDLDRRSSTNSKHILKLHQTKNRATTTTTTATTKRHQPLSILKTILGDCFCEVMPSTDGKGLSPTSQFVQLHGLQYIGLGALEDELTPKQRIYDTLEQLGTSAERLMSIGYLLDDEEAGGGRKKTQSIPLEVWSKVYPNDRSMSKATLRAIHNLRTNQFGAALEDFRNEMNEQQTRPLRDNNFFRIGISAHNVGVISVLAHRDELIIPFFEQAVSSKRVSFGDDHPELAISLDELGIQYFARERFEDALSSFGESRRIKAKEFGQFHPKVVMSLNNIACCNYQMGNLKTASMNLEEANAVAERNIDQNPGAAKANSDLLHRAILLNNLGYLKLSLKQYEDARPLFEEALLIQQSVLGDAYNHRAILDTRKNLEFTNAFHS
eukprot:CAMPEP_0119549306 /NCGR_PEP_ID=MMETSP1352-20130426/3046_1 /TAXON_ID=265584 /ORGANISM="Stauroneis constricta, Strain CCMP1120" /LENGTH=406 /DNA_ID=CAMNT_0007594839 /DNA_START=104 /DNA_END=1324 /DNA_ORIENTATION=+